MARNVLENSLVALIGFLALLVGVYGAFIGACVAVAAYLFQYNLYSIFGKDVPWYLDILGGLALNGLNLPLAIGCCITRACGVEVPFYQ